MDKNNQLQFEQTVDTALGWVAHLRSDSASEQDRQAFALWLAESDANRRAMDEALALWDDLGVVRHMPLATEALPEAANNRNWLPTALAAAACLVLAVFLWPLTSPEPVTAQYQTATGERRDIALQDGSRALLNTGSSLEVTYADDERLITLKRGEAWFQVKPDQERPFHVDAGEARITAIGTAFNVYVHNGTTDITVTEGVVRVTELGETGARAATAEVLRKDQRLLVNPGRWQVSTSDIAQQLAWRSGQLVAREMPLLDLVAQIQRYYDKNIVVTDPDVAAMSVSGVFDLDQPDATLRALALSLDLETEELDDASVRLLKAGQ